MNLKQSNIYKPKLIFKKKVFYCQIGSKGTALSYKKIEGDFKTPSGRWELGKIFIRKDKFKHFKVSRSIANKICYIHKNYFWCHDATNIFYNKLFINRNKSNNKIVGYENLFRSDSAYDIFIELKYNQKPIIKNKGSAIFIHCSFSDYRPTAGCIALRKKDIKFLITNLQKKNYIYIGI